MKGEIKPAKSEFFMGKFDVITSIRRALFRWITKLKYTLYIIDHPKFITIDEETKQRKKTTRQIEAHTHKHFITLAISKAIQFCRFNVNKIYRQYHVHFGTD